MTTSPSSPKTSDEGPWYKQPWAWFVLTPLLTVMIAWIPFMITALKGADDVVVDNYYKEGRMINMRVDEDRAARQLGLSGELKFDMAMGDVVLDIHSIDTHYQWPKTLQLNLDHPMEADKDVVLTLHQVLGSRYRAEMKEPLTHHWYLRLVPPAGEREAGQTAWRVVSEINFDKAHHLSFGFTE